MQLGHLPYGGCPNCRLHLRWFRAVALPIHLAAVNVQVWVPGMPYAFLL